MRESYARRMLSMMQQSDKVWRALRGLAQLLLAAVPLAFLIKSMLVSWEAVEPYEWHISAFPAALSLLFLVAGFCMLPLVDQHVLACFGQKVTWRDLFPSYFYSQLARYLPGGLWVIPGRAFLYSRLGIEILVSGASLVVDAWMLMVVGTLFALPTVFLSDISQFDSVLLALIGAMALGITALHPRIFNQGLHWLMERFGRPWPATSFGWRNILRLVGVILTFWVAVGLGFAGLVISLYPLPLSAWPAMVGVFAASWVAGFLVFLAPAGLGVREGAMALLLAPFVPFPLTIVLPLLARLWWTIGEAICIAVAWVVARRKLGRSISEPSTSNDSGVPSPRPAEPPAIG